nr:hypothetical protein [Bosea sp. LC85]
MLADARLRQVEVIGRPREGAVVDQSNEAAKPLRVHHNDIL